MIAYIHILMFADATYYMRENSFKKIYKVYEIDGNYIFLILLSLYHNINNNNNNNVFLK